MRPITVSMYSESMKNNSPNIGR